MKRILNNFMLILLLLFTITLGISAQETVLKTGISIDKVPNELYGTWRVSSKLISTNSKGLFKEKSVDLWNLSRTSDVIILDNPFTGANASIMIDEVNGDFIKFKKVGDYDSKKLTDTVQLNLGKETFTGINYLKLDTVSEVDGHVIKSETAVYELTGEKISGTSIK